jgi:hypothetical protein
MLTHGFQSSNQDFPVKSNNLLLLYENHAVRVAPFAPHRNSVTSRVDFEGAAVFVFQKAAGLD